MTTQTDTATQTDTTPTPPTLASITHVYHDGTSALWWGDVRTKEQAEAIMAEMQAAEPDALFLVCEARYFRRSEFKVVKAPAVGDDVSRGFNGDYYPCGKVTYVTAKTAAVVRTSNGLEFRRRKNTSSWLQTGGTWSLISGIYDERNPSF